MKKTRRNSILVRFMSCLVLALSVVGLCNAPVFAVETPDYQIGITPYSNSFETMKPGQSYNGSFKVKNTGLKNFNFEISFGPYTIEDENYGPNFSKETKFTDLMDWITVDVDKGSLNPDEEQEVQYTLTIPNDAHGGAQAAAILVTMHPEDSESNGTAVEAVRQLAYLVYGNVDGEITTTAKILENKIPSFIFTPPITATSLVENTGNVYTNATYTLQVFPLFSDEEVYTNEEEPDKNVIFPETKRFYTASWEGAPQLGIFRVRQTIKIFDEVSTVEKLVFLCPIWFLFIVVLIIFVAIFWIVSRIRGRNKE